MTARNLTKLAERLRIKFIGGQDKQKVMTVSAEEFIRRFLAVRPAIRPSAQVDSCRPLPS
jgi:hypothetical protein